MKKSTKVFFLAWALSAVYLFFFIGQIADFFIFLHIGEGLMLQHYLTVTITIIFLAASVFLFFRFLKTQPFNRQIFFVTIPPTLFLTASFILLFWLSTAEPQNQYLGNLRTNINLVNVGGMNSNLYFLFMWIGISLLVYFVYLFLVYFLMTRPIRKSLNYVGKLADGKVKGEIKLGGGKQFSKIQQSLQKINDNYIDTERQISACNAEGETPLLLSKKNLDIIKKDMPTYRYVGAVTTKKKKNSLALFENLDDYSQKKKQLLLDTKPTFEQAVRHFERGDMQIAKQGFEKVLAECKFDRVAKDYLKRCN